MKRSRVFYNRTCFCLICLVFVYVIALQGCSPKPHNSAMDDYNRQIADLKKVSSADSPYVERGSFAVNMEQVRGLAVDRHDDIYVVGDHTIQPFTPSGMPKSAILSEFAWYAVSVDDQGRIYAAAQDGVHVYESLGTQHSIWNSVGVDARLTSISANGQDVYVADAGNKVVYHYDADGKLLETIGKGELVVPSRHLDVCSTGAGRVWIVNPGKHTLFLYADGKIIKSWGKSSAAKEGFSGCCNPTDVTVTKQGHFITSEKGIPRVKMYDPNGNFECIIAGPESFGPNVSGLDLAVDSKGRVLVLDSERKSVRIFERKKNSKQ